LLRAGSPRGRLLKRTWNSRGLPVTTPRNGTLFHFTHLNNLASIAADGLRCDSSVSESGVLSTEVGNQRIKAARRERIVPIAPGGSVADYVPFYFAARSPMMYAATHGGVNTYDGGQSDLVYLVTSVDAVVAAGLPFAFTDRNAVLDYTRYSNDPTVLDDHVDWVLMRQRIWTNTRDQPDRMERRMAEFLVHQHVPWSTFVGIGQVESVLASVGVSATVLARPDWYF
jgi:hypothetical protein